MADKRVKMTYKDEVATLIIKSTVLKDEQVYRCEASNKRGKVDTSCSLIIHGTFKHPHKVELWKCLYYTTRLNTKCNRSV